MAIRKGQSRPHPHADIQFGLYKRGGPWSPIAGLFGPHETHQRQERGFIIRAQKHAKKKRSWVRLGRKHGWF